MSFQSPQSRIGQWIAASRATLAKASRALTAICAMVAAALCLLPSVASAATINAVVSYRTTQLTPAWEIRWDGVQTACTSAMTDFASMDFNFYIDGVKYVGRPTSVSSTFGPTIRDIVVYLPATWPNGTFQGVAVGRVVPVSSWDCTKLADPTPRPVIDTLTMQAPTTPLSSIGGFVSGLGTGESVVLLNNGGGATTVSANGLYFHNVAVPNGAAYAITVQTPPAGKVCTVSAFGSGTADGTSNVISANVSCAIPPRYTIGGTVSGLATGETVILKNNGADDTTVASNTTFSFTTTLLSGAAYAVTVGTAPAGKTCTVSNGAGTVGSANVTNVAVACATPTSIPTLSEWGMIFLSSVIAMVGIATVRRRKG